MNVALIWLRQSRRGRTRGVNHIILVLREHEHKDHLHLKLCHLHTRTWMAAGTPPQERNAVLLAPASEPARVKFVRIGVVLWVKVSVCDVVVRHERAARNVLPENLDFVGLILAQERPIERRAWFPGRFPQ